MTKEPELEESFPHWRFWAGAFAAFIIVLWALSPVLLPFVLGLVLAYFLDPVVDRMENAGAHRGLGALATLVMFTVIFGLLLVLLVPLIQAQVETLAEQLPGILDKVRTDVMPWIQKMLGRYAPVDVNKQLQAAATGYVGNAAGVAGNVLASVLTGGMALFDTIALLIVTPVVAFYMLRDWDKMIASIDKALPRKSVKIIRTEAKKVDDTLAGFLHGQSLVCLALGLYYAVALSLVGLEFAATVGIVVGVLSFIPYVGTITGFVASMGLAVAQFDTAEPILLVLVIYVFGQAVEGNVLAPKLVGDRIGLHPVWVIFALMAGGSLFGFVGVLVALPVAAVLGVLVRFMMNQYLNSKYYKIG